MHLSQVLICAVILNTISLARSLTISRVYYYFIILSTKVESLEKTYRGIQWGHCKKLHAYPVHLRY